MPALEITSKERAYLRSLAVNADTIMQVGKDGVSENLIKTVSDALEARELIKLSVLETAPYSVRVAADAIAFACGAAVISVTGRRFILYRESKENKQIVL